MEYVSMAFALPGESGDATLLTRDLRSPDQEAYTFDVRIAGNTGEPVELATTVESELPPGHGLILIDQTTSETIDLLANPSITLPGLPSESGSFYRLVVGGEESDAEGSVSGNNLPESYSLSQNYPNPFNAGTVISYFLPEPTRVDIRVFDVLGRPIATLFQGERGAGYHRAAWDGRDAKNREVASGVYFYRLTTPGFTATKKMLLLR
jgi:hypothetical protein